MKQESIRYPLEWEGRERGAVVDQWQYRPEGYWQWQAQENIVAIFSTRSGGVSSMPYDSMNLSLGVGDTPPLVLENRRRILDAFPAQLSHLIMAQQVHHNQVGWVGAPNASQGAYDADSAVPGLDGMLVQEPGLVLGMGFADCVPIFLTDQAGSFGGLLHAGWRGTVRGVQKSAVHMLSLAGIEPETLLVGIGPSIGPCCYEVDGGVAAEFHDAMGWQAPLKNSRADHDMLDLWEANRIILENQGVRPENISIAGLCTSCHPDQFFSHRRDHGRTGRMGGYICMKK